MSARSGSVRGMEGQMNTLSTQEAKVTLPKKFQLSILLPAVSFAFLAITLMVFSGGSSEFFYSHLSKQIQSQYFSYSYIRFFPIF